MELTDLKKIGLTQGEIKIYDALLELGESTRTNIAKKSGISPSKIYDVANRLLEKGIISSVKKDGVIHFSAAHPERLKDFIENKENEIKKEKALVDSILPTLLLKYQTTDENTNVEVFYGWGGMKTAYMDMARDLPMGGDNYVFGASIGKAPKQADRFFIDHDKRMKKKDYRLKIIFNEDLREYMPRIKKYTNNKKHQVKFLHTNTFIEFNFYNNVVLFVMLLEKPIVIRVKSDEIVDAFKKFFDSMWKIAKK